ncbi:MAG: O-antigen ligase family protein [Chloroflexi bacterium]|nr:O-antigen ligase family protein [Chloroflexota bacterium]
MNAPNVTTLFGLLSALLAGVMLAVLPADTAVIFLALAALLLLALMTPLAALAVLLIIAPLRTLIATEASFQLPLDIGQLALLLLLAVWALYRIARRQTLLPFTASSVFVPPLLFLAAITPGAFFAASAGAWLNEWLKWVQIILLVWLCLSCARAENWPWLIFCLAMAGLANALIGLYQFFGGSGALHLLIDNRFFRAFGTFGQPNPFGAFMGLLAPLVLAAAWGYVLRFSARWRRQHRFDQRLLLIALFYTACGVLIAVGVLISWSRGAWLGFAAAMLTVILALPRRWWQTLALLTGGTALVLLLLLTGRVPAALLDRLSAPEQYSILDDMRGVDITPENYAVVERLAHWQAALNMARAHPLFGVGAGNYEVVYDNYRLLNWNFPLGHAHNYYLNIFAEAGIIGLATYLTLWLAVFWLTLRARRHPDSLARAVAVGLLGTWTYLSVHSLTDNLYVNNLFLHIGVMLGLLAVLHHQTYRRIEIGTL